MRTPSWRACCCTPESQPMSKPTITALPAAALFTSVSETLPVPVPMILSDTFSLLMPRRASTIASREPCVSLFTTTLSSRLSPALIWLMRASSETAFVCESSCSLRARAASSASVRARFSSSITRNSAPASGTPERPVHLTGVEGVASLMRRPRSSMRERTLPKCSPMRTASPTLSVPPVTSSVAEGPKPCSSSASMT